MRGCYIHPDTGEIDSVFSFPNSPDIKFDESRITVLEISEEIDFNWFYDFESKQFIQKGERPSASHKWDVNTHTWILDIQALWKNIRQQRDLLLAQSDWTDTVSAQSRLPLSVFTEWAIYRQALRDITKQLDPANISWPNKP